MPVFNTRYAPPPWQLPVFSGTAGTDYAIFGNRAKGRIEIYTSGNLFFPGMGKVDLYMTTSGLKGDTGSISENVGTTTIYAGSGGSGGIGKTFKGIKVRRGTYPIVVPGECSSTTVTNKPSALGKTIDGSGSAQNSGGGGIADMTSAGSGGTTKPTSVSVINNASAGRDGTANPFDGDSAEFASRKLCAGGGGGRAYLISGSVGTADSKYGAGGATGGGRGGSTTSWTGGGAGVAGTANTGSGGGGGGTVYDFPDGTQGRGTGGNGGSGIVIIRWGYT